MKQNKHQRRKEIVEFNARECAETIVEEGFSILEYGKSEREISMIKSIQMCLYHKYGISNKQIGEGLYLYYFSSMTEEEVKKVIIQSYARDFASNIIHNGFIVAWPNTNINPYLSFNEEVDEYIEKEFKIVHKEFEGERQIYFLASSNEDKVIKEAYAQIEEEEKKSKKQKDSFLRMLLSILR